MKCYVYYKRYLSRGREAYSESTMRIQRPIVRLMRDWCLYQLYSEVRRESESEGEKANIYRKKEKDLYKLYSAKQNKYS